MRFLLAALALLACLAGARAQEDISSGVTVSIGGPVGPNSHQLTIATPFHDTPLEYAICFGNATDVGNFYGTANTTYISGTLYLPAQGFFAGSPDADAELCYTRIGQTGSRARILGATLTWGATSNLSTLLADCTNGSPCSMTLTQDGIVYTVSSISFTGDTTYDNVATTLNSDIAAAEPAYATVVGSIAPATCTGINGTVSTSLFTVTSVSSNCIVPGGNMQFGAAGNVVEAQSSGTPGGVGVYLVSAPASELQAPKVCAPCTENYSLLSVTSVGSTDTIRSGLALTGGAIATMGIYQMTGGATSCTGSGCAGTQWLLDAAQPDQVTASGPFTAGLCPLLAEHVVYTGVTINSDRMWLEQNPWCTDVLPNHTLAYPSAGTGTFLSDLGWLATAPGVVVTPYSGPYISVFSEVMFDPTPGAYATTYASWLKNFYATIPGASARAGFQFLSDPDLGAQTPTQKNNVSNWFSANAPTYTYARNWTTTAWPEANGALPSCSPGSQVFTTSGSATPTDDHCPVHDFYLIGAAGNSSAANASGAGASGGSGAFSYIQGLTGGETSLLSSSNSLITLQIGAAGGGHGAGNNTEVLNMTSLNVTGDLFAISGDNASAQTGGTANAQGCSYTLVIGTWAAQGCNSGVAGPAPGAGTFDGGAGGSSSGSFLAAGFAGGTTSSTGGGGGAGTAAVGVASSTTSGGNGGLNTASVAGGAGGAGGSSPANGTAPGGGGGGTGTAANAANGANGQSGADFTTLTHACSAGGFGGGGGAGGANSRTSGTIFGGVGGVGGNYGGAGGAGGGVHSGTNYGAAGASAGGYICIVGYQDH